MSTTNQQHHPPWRAAELSINEGKNHRSDDNTSAYEKRDEINLGWRERARSSNMYDSS
jgi:hypothetical protein